MYTGCAWRVCVRGGCGRQLLLLHMCAMVHGRFDTLVLCDQNSLSHHTVWPAGSCPRSRCNSMTCNLRVLDMTLFHISSVELSSSFRELKGSVVRRADSEAGKWRNRGDDARILGQAAYAQADMTSHAAEQAAASQDGCGDRCRRTASAADG